MTTTDGEHDPAVDRTVDATGRPCPIPVIELAKAVDESEVGAVVELLSTDPASGVDVPVWCRMQGQRLVSRDRADGVWTFRVQRTR